MQEKLHNQFLDRSAFTGTSAMLQRTGGVTSYALSGGTQSDLISDSFFTTGAM